MAGQLFVFEGMDGAGKTTMSEAIFRELEQMGFNVLLTKEAGGTELGAKLRKLILDSGYGISNITAALMFYADRMHHIENVILPALKERKIVICDRYWPSTLAYQSESTQDNLTIDEIHNSVSWLLPTPSAFFFLDLPPHLSKARSQIKDAISERPVEYFGAVRGRYFDIIRSHPAPWEMYDATKPFADVKARILDSILSKIK